MGVLLTEETGNSLWAAWNNRIQSNHPAAAWRAVISSMNCSCFVQRQTGRAVGVMYLLVYTTFLFNSWQFFQVKIPILKRRKEISLFSYSTYVVHLSVHVWMPQFSLKSHKPATLLILSNLNSSLGFLHPHSWLWHVFLIQIKMGECPSKKKWKQD